MHTLLPPHLETSLCWTWDTHKAACCCFNVHCNGVSQALQCDVHTAAAATGIKGSHPGRVPRISCDVEAGGVVAEGNCCGGLIQDAAAAAGSAADGQASTCQDKA